MSFVTTKGLTEESLAGKYIFLDNDFLSALFVDFQSLKDLLDLSKRGVLLIDPMTKFEFLQTVYMPKQRELKEAFLLNEIFISATDHQTVNQQVRDNAYTLSYLYGHHNCKGASVVDLFLAGRALLHSPNSLIITGNRKDFPDFVFDLLGVLNREEDGSVRAYSVVSFNKDKYDAAVKIWKDLPLS